MNYSLIAPLIQTPAGTPNPGDGSMLDFSNPFEVIVYIILPIILVVFYFVNRRNQRKNQRRNKGE